MREWISSRRSLPEVTLKPDLESRFPRPSQWVLLAIAVGIGVLVAGLYWALTRLSEMMRSQPL